MVVGFSPLWISLPAFLAMRAILSITIKMPLAGHRAEYISVKNANGLSMGFSYWQLIGHISPLRHRRGMYFAPSMKVK